LWFDIDGPKKGKYMIGSDLFTLYIYFDEDKVGTLVAQDVVSEVVNLCRTGHANACTYWVLNHDNIDYIHCEVTEDNPTCN